MGAMNSYQERLEERVMEPLRTPGRAWYYVFVVLAVVLGWGLFAYVYQLRNLTLNDVICNLLNERTFRYAVGNTGYHNRVFTLVGKFTAYLNGPFPLGIDFNNRFLSV